MRNSSPARCTGSTRIYEEERAWLVVVGGGVVLLVVAIVKAATLQTLTLSHGRCLRQCLQEGLESGVIEVQRRLQQPPQE